MIYQLDILDGDLEYLANSTGCRNSFTMNRWADDDAKKVVRLQRAGIVKQLPYYGDSGCYHPSYELTELGVLVYGQYIEGLKQTEANQ